MIQQDILTVHTLIQAIADTGYSGKGDIVFALIELIVQWKGQTSKLSITAWKLML